jgi:preprotein translocase subunit YajC
VNGGSLLILVALFAVLWLVMIRPQRARQQRQQQLIESVGPGDEVLSVGGLYGIVQEIDEEGDLIVEIADGIHVRLARRSVATVVKPDDEDDAEDDGEPDDEQEDSSDAGTSAGADGEAGVTVPDDEASITATQRRLFGRRN